MTKQIIEPILWEEIKEYPTLCCYNLQYCLLQTNNNVLMAGYINDHAEDHVKIREGYKLILPRNNGSINDIATAGLHDTMYATFVKIKDFTKIKNIDIKRCKPCKTTAMSILLLLFADKNNRFYDVID